MLGFQVSEEAIKFLSSIKEKIGVVAVAGKYRTGKSFLLNRVILDKVKGGFSVGPTINPCTKVSSSKIIKGKMEMNSVLHLHKHPTVNRDFGFGTNQSKPNTKEKS